MPTADDAPSIRLGAIERFGSFQTDLISLAMHRMFFQRRARHRLERPQPNMQRLKRPPDACRVQRSKHVRRKMQPRRRARRLHPDALAYTV